MAEEGVAAESPNIVLIISDDQGWTDYGFMGHPHIRTPNLDRLASQSVTFTRGYVPTSVCRPSLATIVSGLYPHQHGIVGNQPPGRRELSAAQYLQERIKFLEHIDNALTLPGMLGKKGYLSHQSGKWWEGGYQRGGFTHGMTHGDRARGGRHGDEGLTIGREGMKPLFDFMDMAIARDKPFFVWYAPFLPHSPHNPPQRLLEKYVDKTDSIHIARYWAMCEWLDETCGELLDRLDEKGIADNTLVLYVCDNGWIQNAKSWGGAGRAKLTPCEGGIRTPILVRWPGMVKPRMDKTTLVSSIDLAPTFLNAVGLEPTDAMQGVNLLDGDALAERDAIFGEIFEHDIVHRTDAAASLKYRWVIDGDWKLIVPHLARVPKGEVELYDLRGDPHEERNLASDQSERVAQLKRKLDAWWKP
jgi:arylsulfatase A-like enzyme